MCFRLLILISLLPICAVNAQTIGDLFLKKGSPALRSALQKNSTAKESIWWLQTPSINSFKEQVHRNKISVEIIKEIPAIGLVTIRCSQKELIRLLQWKEVIAADLPRIAKEELSLNVYDPSINQISAAWKEYPTLNGKDLVLSVKENRFDTNDIDFKGRYQTTHLISSSFSTHASIMATLAGGAGNSHNSSKGVAWGTKIGSASFQSLLPESDADYLTYKINVQNHSYGTGIENYYGLDAAAYDATTLSNNTLLHVFSAGNAGNLAPAAGTYQGLTGWANLTGSFKMAKNILTIGSVDSAYNIPLLSSRGPAYDGRIKPELVAFGDDGSSGAAALSSGTALLVQQLFKDLKNRTPESFLVRAIMINSADDLGQKGPDFISGFGKLNAVEALHTVSENRFETGSVNAAQNYSREIEITPGTAQLKITLSWNDPVAPVNAAKSLVNDLDLELEYLSNGNIWLPWVPNSSPHPDSLQAAAIRKKDTLNNNEQVILDAPASGLYRIHVKAYHLQTNSQSFAIVWETKDSSSFRWYAPTTGDITRPGSPIQLRWRSGAEKGKLEYSKLDGNWTTIESAINLTTGFKSWMTPVQNGLLNFRMTVNGIIYYSDTLLIVDRTDLSTGFNCADSFLLYWKAIPGINTYQLSRLGNTYLEPIRILSDTQVVLPKSQYPEKHYSITPLFQGRAGIRSYTIQYEDQGVDCYLQSFLADLNNDNTVSIRYGIGTLFQVKSLQIEKWKNNTFITLSKTEPVLNKSGTYIDKELVKGGNLYRIAIELTNGTIIYSEIATVYFLDKQDHLVFPNPVNRSSTFITIVSRDLLEGNFSLYNMQGQLVYTTRITDLITRLSISRLQKGIYLYKISVPNKASFQGKLIVQ